MNHRFAGRAPDFSATVDDPDYEAFPNVEARNRMQRCMEIPIMLSLLGIREASCVLEIGCGRGVALEEFYRRLRPREVIGVDIDASLVRAAAERVSDVPGIRSDVGDARSLPYAENTFDAVFDFGTCYHISRHGEALREIARVLRPGGIFVYETGLSQLISHPVRAKRLRLDWRFAPELRSHRRAALWNARRKSP